MRIENEHDKKFIENIVEDIVKSKYPESVVKGMLENIYLIGVNEGQRQVVKNAIDFMGK